MSNYVDTALDALKHAGHRLTEQRRVVLEVLSTARVPLTPAELHERVKARGRSMDLVSVYRILETLQDNGLVHHVIANNSFKACSHYFESSEGRKPHGHEHSHDEQCHHLAICTECGKSYEFDCPQLEEIAEAVTRDSGIKISRHLLEFQGVCKNCKAA